MFYRFRVKVHVTEKNEERIILLVTSSVDNVFVQCTFITLFRANVTIKCCSLTFMLDGQDQFTMHEF